MHNFDLCFECEVEPAFEDSSYCEECGKARAREGIQKYAVYNSGFLHPIESVDPSDIDTIVVLASDHFAEVGYRLDEDERERTWERICAERVADERKRIVKIIKQADHYNGLVDASEIIYLIKEGPQ